MARHLVSELDRKARLGLRDEIVARLEVADAAVDAYVKKHPDHEAETPELLLQLREACMAGFGFAVEEVRNAQLVKQAEKKG